jgi:hypothetical protein
LSTTSSRVDLDDDNDGFADTFDCSPFDPLNSAPSALEVKNDAWVRGPVRRHALTWQNQGAGVIYDVAGGLISQLRPDAGTSGAVCLPGGDNLGLAEFAETRPDPLKGDAYYYIVLSEAVLRERELRSGFVRFRASPDERLSMTRACSGAHTAQIFWAQIFCCR